MASSLFLSLCAIALLQLVHGSTECVHAITVDLNFSNNDSCNTAGDICGSLQSAFDTLSTSSTEDNCTLILLPPGTHYISAPRLLRTGVHLRGTADHVTVSCSYSSSNDTNEYYSWYFSNSTMVVFEGLNFEQCPYPFRINSAVTVTVDNCSFRYFTEAVLDIYNCQSTSLTNSSFVDNTGTGISNSSYRGNTGAVSIGFNNVPDHISFPNVQVSGCNFTNNSATAHSVFRTTSQAFFSQIFSGRGGALGVFINESFYNISVVISDCRFEHNYARSFGGGMFLIFTGFNTQHTINVDRTWVISNMAVLGGGGVQVSYISNGIPGSPHMVNFTDCVFDGNRGVAGGGMYVYPSFVGGDGNFMKLERCHFTGNQGSGTQDDYGAAVALSLLSLLREKESLPRHEVVDCTFAGNYGTNGIVSVGYTPMIFRGTNRFIRNSGTSTLRVVGTVVDLFGTLEFINNTSPQDEAALHLLSFGQVRLQRGLNMTFAGNIGRFGASILVDFLTSSIAFDRLVFNPQCFALYEIPSMPPTMWTDVTIRFRENRAILGSALLASHLGSCSWFSLAPPYFNKTSILDWPVWDFGNDSVNTGYPDPMNSTYYVETAPETLTSSTTSVAVSPGFRFSLDVSGMDQFNHLTTATARFFTPSSKSNYTVNFDPEIVIVDSDPETRLLTQNFTLTYTISSATELQLNKSLGQVDIRDPFETVQVFNDSFVLYPLPCPGGYTLQPSPSAPGSVVCQCQDNVTLVIHCEDDQDTVVIENGYWAVFTPSISGSNLEFYPCPPGYCACTQYSDVGNTTCVYTYTNSDPDRQCACDRKGVLCGQCRGDKGVSALLNKCVSCHDASGLLIAGLIIADAVVFIVLTLLDHPLPSWTYPFLFYLQLAPYVTDYFPESFETVGEYLHFASSASGFYFVYDFCLYGNMSALVSYFIRYLPLFVALLLCPLVVILRKCKMRLLHHHMHGLWWILLLLYSHLVHTSMSILDCPMLRDPSDQTVRPRWFVNGEVPCFTGLHLPLALLAMAVLLLCFLLIPLTTIISLDILKKPRWLRHFVPPLTAVFREEVKWWSGVELGRRFLFLLFFIPFPRNAASPTLVLAIIITVYGFVQPYKSRAANLLEIGVQVNFLLLLLIEATSNIRDLYFTFPPLLQSNMTSEPECVDSPTGIAPITWILMPFYYLPLLVFTVVACITFALYIRERLLLTKPTRLLTSPQAQNDIELEVTEYHQYTHEMFFQSLSLPRSENRQSRSSNNSTASEGTNN